MRKMRGTKENKYDDCRCLKKKKLRLKNTTKPEELLKKVGKE